MYTLGIDLSTQSLTLSVLDIKTFKNIINISIPFNSLDEIKNSKMNVDTMLIDSSIEGVAEQDINIFLSSIDIGFKKLSNSIDISQIKAIQISAQQHGHVYLSENYKKNIEYIKNKESINKDLVSIFKDSYSYPNSPIWRTSCSEIEASQLRDSVGGKKAIIDITGSDSPLRFTGAVIKYYFNHYKGLEDSTYKILLINTFLASILSAEEDVAVDFANASGMSLMDYSKKDWNDTLLNTVSTKNLKSKLGIIDSPTNSAGFIATYFIDKYGFSKDCIVGIGSGDNPQTKVLASGDILSLGSSFVYMLNIDNSVRDYDGVSNAMYDGIGNPFMIFCRTNGAILWDSVRKLYNKTFDDITTSLESMNDSLPLSFWQKENESVPISRAFDIVRYYDEANFENDYKGIVLSSLQLVEYYSRKFSSSNSLSVTGGPTKNKEILKIVANIWKCPIKVLPSGGASLGACLSATLLLDKNIVLDDIIDSLTSAQLIYPDDKLCSKYSDYRDMCLSKFFDIIK